MTGNVPDSPTTTVSGNFLTKDVPVPKMGTVAVMKIWDTAGQEKTQSINEKFFAGVDGCILVYDVSSHFSFETLEDWYEEFKAKAMPPSIANFPFLVIGNKTDLGKSNVTPKEALQWCSEKSMNVKIQHFEASAKSNINVKEAFEALAHQCIRCKPSKSGTYDNTLTLNQAGETGKADAPSPSPGNGCCVVS